MEILLETRNFAQGSVLVCRSVKNCFFFFLEIRTKHVRKVLKITTNFKVCVEQTKNSRKFVRKGYE